MRSGTDQPFTARYIARIQMRYGLKPRYDRLRALGMLTLDEIAHALEVHPKTVKKWAVYGLVRGHAYSDKQECLFEPPGQDAPRKAQGTKLSQRMQPDKVVPQCFEEVQCEA
jgi:hypothetical protein